MIAAAKASLKRGDFAGAQREFERALLRAPRNAWLLDARDAAARCAGVLATPTRPSTVMTLRDEPRFIVLGVQKCGTTALYGYICQHPHVLTARRKETHFFDWNWSTVCAHTLRPEQRAQLLRATAPADELSRARMGALDAKSILGGSAAAGAGDHVVGTTVALPPSSPPNAGDARALHQSRDPLELRNKYLLMFPTAAMRASPAVALVSGEATPSYFLYGSLVAQRIKAVCPNARLIVAVRNPIARAYSHYQMTRDTRGSAFVRQIRGCAVLGEKTFEEALDDDVRQLRAAGLPATLLEWTVGSGGGGGVPAMDVKSAGSSSGGGGGIGSDSGEDDAAGAWRDDAWQSAAQASYFDTRPNGHGAHSYIGRGLFALQLRLWLRHFPREQIEVVDIDEMRDATRCVEVMRSTFAFLGLPPHEIPDTAPRNTKEQRGRAYGPIAPATASRLGALFAPHNAELARLCGREFAGWS